MPRATGRTGVDHLAVLAREPRPAGSEAEARARDYAAGVLRDAGFDVRREPFAYSRFPGRYGTPIGGVIGGATLAAAAWLALGHGAAGAALAILATGSAAVALFARPMMGEAVLTLPVARAHSENLVATRGVPQVWLVAHTDSKSQPVPSAVRIAGVGLMIAALVLAAAAALLQLAGGPDRTIWWAAVVCTALGTPPVIASVAGTRSPGAVDNASGVATVLAAAQLLRRELEVGVLLPSAEELGLAGARAWARSMSPGIALNCDGVDDEGELTIMHRGHVPARVVAALQAAAPAPLRLRRMPLGLLTDSLALTERGWAALTVSKGSTATLRRVHTVADSLASLRGDGIDDVARTLARAVEELA